MGLPSAFAHHPRVMYFSVACIFFRTLIQGHACILGIHSMYIIFIYVLDVLYYIYELGIYLCWARDLA